MVHAGTRTTDLPRALVVVDPRVTGVDMHTHLGVSATRILVALFGLFTSPEPSPPAIVSKARPGAANETVLRNNAQEHGAHCVCVPVNEPIIECTSQQTFAQNIDISKSNL